MEEQEISYEKRNELYEISKQRMFFISNKSNYELFVYPHLEGIGSSIEFVLRPIENYKVIFIQPSLRCVSGMENISEYGNEIDTKEIQLKSLYLRLNTIDHPSITQTTQNGHILFSFSNICGYVLEYIPFKIIGITNIDIENSINNFDKCFFLEYTTGFFSHQRIPFDTRIG